MVGDRSARHEAYGWAAARLDDLVNLPASRLSAAADRRGRRADSGRRSAGRHPRRQARRPPSPLAQCWLAGGRDGRVPLACGSRAPGSMAASPSRIIGWERGWRKQVRRISAARFGSIGRPVRCRQLSLAALAGRVAGPLTRSPRGAKAGIERTPGRPVIVDVLVGGVRPGSPRGRTL